MSIKGIKQAKKDLPHFDMVIVGGGMVGISLALILAAQSDWKILLVEAQSMNVASAPKSHYSASFDDRSTALSWTSRNIYQSIGIWDQLSKHLTDIKHIHVSDRGHGGLTRMSADEAGVDALGYVVENHWLGSVLIDQLGHHSIETLSNTKVSAVRPMRGGIEISLDGKQSAGDEGQQLIRSDLLIIADGSNSKTAQKLGIYSQCSSYRQTAIIANIQLEKKHQGTAYERFTDQGPMALLPLSDYQGQHRSALVWVQSEDAVEQLVMAEDDAFLATLQQRFGHRLGRFQQVGKRVTYPLSLTLATEQVRRNVVVVGNAAHSLHPVAGQGFNLSLRDVSALAARLNQAREIQKDIGSLEVLENYYQQQLVDQRNTLMFSDSLTKFFTGTSRVSAAGRNSGLLALDLVPQLRHGFAKFGMGMATSEAQHG
jgi:2-polyprenyl-6-methoxyphenol 4-hydroxylase|tara:strand:- start:1936 stop:3219 length:1284 start_codon:yes stop_codon:yes gene_type:complete